MAGRVGGTGAQKPYPNQARTEKCTMLVSIYNCGQLNIFCNSPTAGSNPVAKELQRHGRPQPSFLGTDRQQVGSLRKPTAQYKAFFSPFHLLARQKKVSSGKKKYLYVLSLKQINSYTFLNRISSCVEKNQ